MNYEWTRLYNKAMNFYNNGYINKSLEICDKILADDLSNSEALNLKGLILYQKGLLKDAQIIWKLNFDINNDKIAKKYIEDSKSDHKREKIYIEAEQNLKNMNINKALSLFRECEQSDFNSINVNTGIAMCYQRKGDNSRIKEYIDKVLLIDNESITANIIKKDLVHLGIYTKNKSMTRKAFIIITVIVIIGLISVGGYNVYGKINRNNLNAQYSEKNIEEYSETEVISNIEGNDNISEINPDEKLDEVNKQSNLQNGNENRIFNNEDVLLSIKARDLDKLYEQLDGVSKESISEENLELYNKAIDLLKTEGVSKFYEYGVWYFNNENYESAKEELDKAYMYSDESYLKEHIVFYKASNASQRGNNIDALKLYKEYYSLYPNGTYIEGVLYELALLTNTTNKSMGKEYAKELISNYPNSLYINDYIREIVN